MPDTKPVITNYDKLRYNHVRARGSHNSYQRDEDLVDQMLYWRLRHVELDLHTARTRFNLLTGFLPGLNDEPAPDGDWWVYHVYYPTEKPNVQTFSDGLALLAGFHKAVPDHEVVTVALDIKNQFSGSGHTPEKLDALIERFLPNLVYRPADLLKGVKDPKKLQDGANHWPLLKDVRGKFIFILTTGDLSPGSQLSQYIAGGAEKRICFVAPEIDRVAQITVAQNKDAVFLNTTVDNAPKLGPEVFKKGLVSRAYGANNKDKFNRAKAAKCHLIGTDDVNTDRDHWSRTHNVHGWPFQGIEVNPAASLVEPGLILQAFVRSSDIYGREDNCFFKYNEATSTADVTYTWAVLAASSHVANDNGKVGLMARAGTGKGAANFAVLRVADKYQPRVQVRLKAGENTSEYKLDTAATPRPGISGESWMWLRLRLTKGGKTAEGFTSYDGVYWKLLHKADFGEALKLQGLVCSSHDTARDARYYFIPNEGVNRFALEARIGDVRSARWTREFSVAISDD